MIMNSYEFHITTIPISEKVRFKSKIHIEGCVIAECENDARMMACEQAIKLFKKSRQIEEVLIQKIEKNEEKI